MAFRSLKIACPEVLDHLHIPALDEQKKKYISEKKENEEKEKEEEKEHNNPDNQKDGKFKIGVFWYFK